MEYLSECREWRYSNGPLSSSEFSAKKKTIEIIWVTVVYFLLFWDNNNKILAQGFFPVLWEHTKIKEFKLPKYKKTVSLFLYFEGQMHLYLSVYLYFYAIILLKQYLITFYAHLLQNILLLTISIFHLQFILSCA